MLPTHCQKHILISLFYSIPHTAYILELVPQQCITWHDSKDDAIKKKQIKTGNKADEETARQGC